ncbi:hypothetical protein GCM10022384_01740 [Streptomyces marokkonensis]|uniref:Uncharacterized protein n=1 Tax=Streptomyces marokkonensis TaxID=324855 RepID=A0ABP7NQ51_9ACTN
MWDAAGLTGVERTVHSVAVPAVSRRTEARVGLPAGLAEVGCDGSSGRPTRPAPRRRRSPSGAVPVLRSLLEGRPVDRVHLRDEISGALEGREALRPWACAW